MIKDFQWTLVSLVNYLLSLSSSSQIDRHRRNHFPLRAAYFAGRDGSGNAAIFRGTPHPPNNPAFPSRCT